MAQNLPAPKAVPGTPFAVDAFRYRRAKGITHWFLTHAHSDHYGGLDESFPGPVLCSETTARFVVSILGVPRGLVRPLPMGVPVVIEGVTVVAVDANHCPGACQLLFTLPDGTRILHSGDMRYSPAFKENPFIRGFVGCDAVYLDTTYCNPRYTFPDQAESIDYVVRTVSSALGLPLSGAAPVAAPADVAMETDAEEEEGGAAAGPSRPIDIADADLEEQQLRRSGVGGAIDGEDGGAGPGPGSAMLAAASAGGSPRGGGGPGAASPRGEGVVRPTLVLISTYGIGKERILLALRDRLGLRCHAGGSKIARIASLGIPGLNSLFVSDPAATPVHVVDWGELGETWPYFKPNFTSVQQAGERYGASRVLGFVPTGWMYELKKHTFSVRRRDNLEIHLVPYSEHSSFAELREYISFLRPARVVPTVGVSGEDPEKAAASMLKHFSTLIDSTASKRKFLGMFGRGNSSGGGVTAGGGLAAAAAQADAVVAAGVPGAPPAKVKAAASVPPVAAISDDDDEIEVLQEGPEAAGSPTAAEGVGRATAAESAAAGASDRGPGRLQVAVGQQAVAGGAMDDSDPSPRDAIGPFGSSLGDQGASGAARRGGRGGQGTPEEEEKPPPPLSGPSRASPDDLAVLDLCAVIGVDPADTVRVRAAKRLLDSARGDLAAAADAFFTRGLPAAGGGPVGTNASAGGKRGAPVASPGSNPAAPVGKRPKGTPAPAAGANRSLLSYFGGGEGQTSDRVASLSQPNRAPARKAGRSASPSTLAKRPLTATPAEGGAAGAEDSDVVVEVLPSPSPAPRPAAAAAATAGPERAATEAAATANRGGQAAAGARKGDVGGSPTVAQGPLSSQLQQGAAGSPAPTMSVAAAKSGGGDGPVDPMSFLKPPREYDPVAMAGFKAGAPVPYLCVARALHAAASTSSRLSTADAITNLFRTVLALTPEDLLPTAYLLLGRIAPDHMNLETKIGESTVAAAIVDATGASRARLGELYRATGDLGDAAQSLRVKQRMLVAPAALTARRVFAALKEMALDKGQGSSGRRQASVASLIRACRDEETRYLVRTLISNLRVGANWRSVVPALGRAFRIHEWQRTSPHPSLPPKSELDAAAQSAQECFHLAPALEELARLAREFGILGARGHCGLRPGTPVMPMLAKICQGILDGLRMAGPGPVLVEHKLDGMRAQIHVFDAAAEGPDGASAAAASTVAGSPFLDGSGRAVRIYSRNGDDSTAKFHDAARLVLGAMDPSVRTVVLDCEIVGVERTLAADEGKAGPSEQEDSGSRQGAEGISVEAIDHPQQPPAAARHRTCVSRRLCAFQELSTRPKGGGEKATSRGAASNAKEVDVCVFAFDCLHAGDRTLVGQPLSDRRAAMEKVLSGVQYGYVELAEGFVIQNAPPEAYAVPDAEPSKPRRAAKGRGPSGGTGKGTAKPRAEALPAAAAAASVSLVTAGEGEGEADPEGEEEGGLEGRVTEALLSSLSAGAEGLMLKPLGKTYEPCKRSDHWVKIKRDFCEGLRDSLDLVPIGAWYGNGRKHGWFSPFLLAAYNPETETFESVCRCMSGFTDAFYAEATERFTAQGLLSAPLPNYNTGESCSVWFRPGEVWELRGADLSISPVHRSAAGLVHDERGVSLRFPRFIRLRPDKAPEDATNSEQIAELYLKQTRRLAGSGLGQGLGGAAPVQAAGKHRRGTGTEHGEDSDVEAERDGEGEGAGDELELDREEADSEGGDGGDH